MIPRGRDDDDRGASSRGGDIETKNDGDDERRVFIV
jgi:hypothetical protein